jgi:hypothetical protein
VPQPHQWGRVVRASRLLSPAEKLVYDELRQLDQGEGSWISARGLALRIGMEERTVEAIRDELRRLGLLRSEGKPPRGVRYLVRLPTECVPTPRPRDDHVVSMAALLDAHLAPLLPARATARAKHAQPG